MSVAPAIIVSDIVNRFGAQTVHDGLDIRFRQERLAQHDTGIKASTERPSRTFGR